MDWTPTKMSVMSCPLGAECNKGPAGAIWKTDDVAAELIAIVLATHVKYALQNVAAAPATLAAEKLIRPKVQVRDGVIEEEAWEYFVHCWTTYKSPLSSKLSVGNTSLQNTKKYKVLSPNVLGCLPSPNRTKSYKSDRSLQISFLVMRGRKDHLQYLPQFSVKNYLVNVDCIIYTLDEVLWSGDKRVRYLKVKSSLLKNVLFRIYSC